MRFRSSFQRGITLIEMMVVVALVGILAVMAIQFGSGWTNNARVTQTQAALQHAYSSAKSAALQNPLGVSGDDVSASLCVGTGRVTVVTGSNCTAKAIWSELLPNGAAARIGSDGKATCVALNNTGLPVDAAGCTTDSAYSAVAGEIHVEKNLY